MQETEIYAPVKAWLETLGYEVKAEIGAADVVAVREGCVPLIVELKVGFSLTLLHQAVSRQTITDDVYIAVPRWKGRAGWKVFKKNTGLCKRLGLGVLSVDLNVGIVQVHADPAPFKPRKVKARKAALLSEFSRRVGDPNVGGTRGKLVTAYLQESENMAAYLAENGPTKGAIVAKATGVSRATRMMANNHYGWFERAEKGIYRLTTAGHAKFSGD